MDDRSKTQSPLACLGFQLRCLGAFHGELVMLCLIGLAIPHLASAAGLRVCPHPGNADLPAETEARLQQDLSGEPSHYGFRTQARQVLANRRDLRSGHITAAQADQQGGRGILGTREIIVFPFLYSNSNAPFPAADLQQQLFDGPWATGTLREFYEENSYGQFSVDGVVESWEPLPQNDGYYEGSSKGTGGDARTDQLIVHILDARDGDIDFSQYDNDGPDGMPNSGDDDGFVDFVAFVSPDISGSCSAPPNDNMWPHQGTLTGWWGKPIWVSDDISNNPPNGANTTCVDAYFMTSGLRCEGSQDGIGTFAHEFGHALDIVDLYDPNQHSYGIGYWGLMAYGGNHDDRPAHMTAWCKERLGWLSYFNVNQDISSLCLPPVETHPVAARVWLHGEESAEYFLVENRQPIGFDDELPGRGLVIYHINEDNYEAKKDMNLVQSPEFRKAVDVECADASSAEPTTNTDDLDDKTNLGDAGDTWCNGNQAIFDDLSIPDSRSLVNGYPQTGLSITALGPCQGDVNGQICATFDVGVPLAANLCISDCANDGCAEITTCDRFWATPNLWIDNDDDGIDDYPAENTENHLYFRFENVGPSALANVNIDFYYGDPAMGQKWPSTGTLIGSKSIAAIDMGGEAEDYVVFEYPDPPDQVDHYCIGAVVTHDLDPQNSEYPPNDNNVAQVNHQVLVARADGGILASNGDFTRESKIYIYQNAEYGRLVEVRLGSPPDFDDWAISEQWILDFDPGPYLLTPGGIDSVLVTMSSVGAGHDAVAHVPMTLWDVSNEKAAGGVILDYRVDCFDPIAPENLTASYLEPPLDRLGGPNVKVEWDKVILDVQALSEVVKLYEVFRADDQGGVELQVARVAIDAEPSEAGFQWYDSVVLDCDILYTYRVRAVDAADARGEFAVFELACPITGQEEAPTALAWGLSQNHPNPFREGTTVAFQLDREARIRLEIFDFEGRRVTTLADRTYSPGSWEVSWDGKGDSGRPVAAGTFLYKLSEGARTLTGRMTILP